MLNSLLKTDDKGEEYVYCPRCMGWHPRSDYEEFTMVPRFAHLLTPVFQCRTPIGEDRECRHIFAITEQAIVMRQNLALGMVEEG